MAQSLLKRQRLNLHHSQLHHLLIDQQDHYNAELPSAFADRWLASSWWTWPISSTKGMSTSMHILGQEMAQHSSAVRLLWRALAQQLQPWQPHHQQQTCPRAAYSKYAIDSGTPMHQDESVCTKRSDQSTGRPKNAYMLPIGIYS